MRYAIYTILGLITLGMISTAVLSQETDQNWRLIYRPMAMAKAECWKIDQIRLAATLLVPSLQATITKDTLVLAVPELGSLWIGFDADGCVATARVIQ
jgi:hypothetical protein